MITSANGTEDFHAIVPNTENPLDILKDMEKIMVIQQAEMQEMMTGEETCNRYIVKNVLGTPLLKCVEESNCCKLNYCDSKRSFIMKIEDSNGREVLSLDRPLRCSMCFCFCCLQKIVAHSSGTKIGSVRQNWGLLHTWYSIKNSEGNVVLRIKGPYFTCACDFWCFRDIHFTIYSKSGEKVGEIIKNYTSEQQEKYTDIDNFTIICQKNMPVEHKGLLISNVILIDYMFYERRTKKIPKDGPRVVQKM